MIGLLAALVATPAVAMQDLPAHAPPHAQARAPADAQVHMPGHAPARTGAQAAPALARDGRTRYVIALARDAIPAEAAAARELAAYLRQITGAAFAVRPETKVRARAPQILVGAGERVKRLLPRQDWAALGEDGVVIKSVGRKLVLAGGRPRGTLYAVV